MPELQSHLQYYWNAFWVLTTERSLGYGAVGPIPYTSAMRYAEDTGMTDVDQKMRFWYLINDMDAEFLVQQRKSVDSTKEKTTPPKKR